MPSPHTCQCGLPAKTGRRECSGCGRVRRAKIANRPGSNRKWVCPRCPDRGAQPTSAMVLGRDSDGAPRPVSCRHCSPHAQTTVADRIGYAIRLARTHDKHPVRVDVNVDTFADLVTGGLAAESHLYRQGDEAPLHIAGVLVRRVEVGLLDEFRLAY